MSSQQVFLSGKNSQEVRYLQELADLIDDYSSILLCGIGSDAGGSVIFRNNGKLGAISYFGYKALENEYLQSNQQDGSKADDLRHSIEARLNEVNPAQ